MEGNGKPRRMEIIVILSDQILKMLVGGLYSPRTKFRPDNIPPDNIPPGQYSTGHNSTKYIISEMQLKSQKVDEFLKKKILLCIMIPISNIYSENGLMEGRNRDGWMDGWMDGGRARGIDG